MSDEEIRLKLDEIAGHVKTLAQILTGNGAPDRGMVVRFDRVQRTLDTLPCAQHGERLRRIEGAIQRALFIYGGVMAGMALAGGALFELVKKIVK
jgi:hypothetical protein